MIMIFFSEFAQKMGRVIKGKATNGDFTFRLLTAVLPEKKKDLIGNIPNSTLRNYYNGISGITQIARKIYADASTASFEKFINDHGKNARTKLSEVFSDVIPEITPENTGKNLAKLFLQIIKDAAEDIRDLTGDNISEEVVKTVESDRTIINAHVIQNGADSKSFTITSYAPISLTFPSGGGGYSNH